MFNIESFDIKLDTNFIGRNFIYAEEIDSTNAALLNKENNFNYHGTVVLAEKQNKGKGRKNRVWQSARGQNLTFSILILNKKYLKRKISMINFAAALAVANAIENMYQLPVELKWPNDVLINGKKVAGILLESSFVGKRLTRVVAGVGLNVNQIVFQGSFQIEPTSIKIETDYQNIERERLLAEILNLFEGLLEKYLNDTSLILKEWKDHCRMIGEKISISDENVDLFGIFEDVDEDGYLLLRTKNKIERIHFGDVSLR